MALTKALGGGGGGGSGTVTTVKDEGSTLSSAVTSIDFVGGGVTATGTTSVTVTIPTGANIPNVDLINFWPSSASKATASSSYALTPPIGLFLRMAGNTAGWITNATSTGWAKIEFPSAFTVKVYAIAPWSVDTYPSRTPKTWTFEGSNDDSMYTVLDTQTNYTTWAQYQRVAFTTSNTTAYKFYKINVTANQGDTYMGMGGLWLYGQPS